jgi:hypothetical protein
MDKDNNFNCIAQHFSPISPGHGELITPEHISNAAIAITEELKALNKNHNQPLEKVWSFFCFEAGVNAKPPRQITVRAVQKVIKKYVKKACFAYDQTNHCFDKDFIYTSKRYVKQYKLLKGLNIYSKYLFSVSEDKRLNASASQHLTELVGMASLALKDGLKPVNVTFTLDSKYHSTADESAKHLLKALLQLNYSARNNKLMLEYARMLEPQKNGMAHLHAIMFTNDVDKLKSLLQKTVAKCTEIGDIQCEETENLYASILYLVKDEWAANIKDDDEDPVKKRKSSDRDRLKVWRKSQSSRCYSKSSNVRKYPPVALYDAFRKGRFNAIDELDAVNRLEEKLYLTEHDHVSGESYVQLSDYSKHIDRADAFDSITSQLTSAVRGGDYAEFTRVFTTATNSRKQPVFHKMTGLNTAGSLGKLEIAEITKLATIRQVVIKFGDKIRDIEDLKYILRTKKRHGISMKYRKRREKVDKFMQNFRESQSAGHQLALI